MAHAAHAYGAYKRAMIATSGPRALEAEAFERINAELRQAQRSREQNYPAFVAALSRNSRLWTILAADVADDANALPRDTRIAIWRLSAFVRCHTQKLLQPNSAAPIDPLLAINLDMIAGLRAKKAGTGA
ncbi:MAG: flagellar biosynthesis regulator FlaF [Parvularculaceae bacterium]|nr:flagellar biosynthesis regulator FlaF [Parvularculaceae bacterium]